MCGNTGDIAGHTIFDSINMGLANNLSYIEDEENKIYKKWNIAKNLF